MRNMIFLLLLLAGLYSCTKPQAIQPTYVSAGIKSYFDYKPGSYWIFYDSVNNYFDSVVVTNYADQQVTTTSTSTEQVQIAMEAFYEDTEYAAYASSPWSMFLAGNTCSIMPTLPLYSNYNRQNGDELAIGMPFQTGTNTFNNSQHEQIIMTTTLLPSYTVGAVTYSNVYQVINSFNSYYYADTFYLNQDHGFIAILFNSQFHERLFLSRDVIVH